MIKVLSYGSGNVKAITNIFHRLNIPCGVASQDEDLKSATKLILPGVGAFDQTMRLLETSGMLNRLNRMVVDERVPVLGVCVGMQIMGNESQEGHAKGLGWIDGQVLQIDTSQLDFKPKLPHMGWNSITPKKSHPIFGGVDFEKGFYFLHSYYFSCQNEDEVLATCNYGDEFTSAVLSNNIYGFQFHPEKSHDNGISVLKNFSEI